MLAARSPVLPLRGAAVRVQRKQTCVISNGIPEYGIPESDKVGNYAVRRNSRLGRRKRGQEQPAQRGNGGNTDQLEQM